MLLVLQSTDLLLLTSAATVARASQSRWNAERKFFTTRLLQQGAWQRGRSGRFAWGTCSAWDARRRISPTVRFNFSSRGTVASGTSSQEQQFLPPTCQISTENMGSLSAELLINCARRMLHHLQSRSANCAGIFQESQIMGRVSGGEGCTVASLGAISQQRTVQVHAQRRTASASSLHSYRKDLLLPRSLHPTLSNNRLHRDYRTRKWHTSTHFISSREDMVCLTSARRQIALSGEHISRL